MSHAVDNYTRPLKSGGFPGDVIRMIEMPNLERESNFGAELVRVTTETAGPEAGGREHEMVCGGPFDTVGLRLGKREWDGVGAAGRTSRNAAVAGLR